MSLKLPMSFNHIYPHSPPPRATPSPYPSDFVSSSCLPATYSNLLFLLLREGRLYLSLCVWFTSFARTSVFWMLNSPPNDSMKCPYHVPALSSKRNWYQCLSHCLILFSQLHQDVNFTIITVSVRRLRLRKGQVLWKRPVARLAFHRADADGGVTSSGAAHALTSLLLTALPCVLAQ